MSDFVFVIINNIPAAYHSRDLRNFFSQFIETNGFECFHYRHRPEVKKPKGCHSEPAEGNQKSETCCCVAKLLPKKCQQFLEMYSRMHWLDTNGESLPVRCFINKIKITDNEAEQRPEYQTRQQQSEIDPDREQFTAKDLQSLAELHPPLLMPKGNVGTPTSVFLKHIRTCKLPAKLIGKLGLVFARNPDRRYGSVFYDYGTGTALLDQTAGHSGWKDSRRVTSARGQLIRDIYFEKKSPVPEEDADDTGEDARSEEDVDDCEEWERHEALHDNVTDQERTKERLFEEEIELKWEKGGSGLVFYTDAQHWDELEGDFDAKTSDDWDIDMSVYYEPGAGDKDARDFITMRRDLRRRDGTSTETVFKKPIGKFESHTKGIGRKVMEKQGWQDGDGLGKKSAGIAEALESDGQNPRDKKGFGYHGEKLVRFPTTKPRVGKLISTVYDKPGDVDKPEPLYRSNLKTTLKHRAERYSDSRR